MVSLKVISANYWNNDANGGPMAGVYIFILLFQFILATAWFCSTIQQLGQPLCSWMKELCADYLDNFLFWSRCRNIKCHIGIPPVGDNVQNFAVWTYESCSILNFARIYCSGSPKAVQSVWNIGTLHRFFDSNKGNVFHCTKMKFSMKDFFIFCAAFVSYVNCWIYIFALSLSYNLSMYIFIHDFPVTVFVASLSGIAGFLGFESSFLVYAVYVLFFLLQDSFEQNDICFHKSHGVLCVLGIVLEELIWFWLIFFVFLMCFDGFCIYFHFLSSNCFFQKRCQFHFYVFGSCFPKIFYACLVLGLKICSILFHCL